MKRQLLIVVGFALFVFAILCLKNIPLNTSAQATSDETLLLQMPVPNNVNATRIRSASNDGRRMVFESLNNYTGGNGDGNGEVYLYDVNSLSVIQITNTQNYTDSSGIVINVSNTQPIISGDGTRIVFISNAPALDPAFPNPNGNYDLYYANLSVAGTPTGIFRITNTGRERSDENLREIFTTISPSINDDGNRIAFVAGRQIFNAVNGFPAFNADNADLENDIFIADLTDGARRYSQVTVSRRADRPPSFNAGGFNINPKLSGNGEMLAFLSDYNYDNNRNTEFDPELFIYRIADGTFRQVTVTKSLSPGNYNAVIPIFNLSTGTFTIDITAGMQVLDPFSKPLSRDGMRFVFESSGDLDGGNPNRARQLWVYDFTNNTTTRITTQSVSAAPTQDELSRVDHTFTPSFNSAGTIITFNSTLNLVPTSPNDVNTDNADASSEFFIYNTANGSFRQLTFTQISAAFLDQRFNKTVSFISDVSATGETSVSFNYISQLLLPNAPNVIDLFQVLMRPITSANNGGTALANAISFNTNQIARGSRAINLNSQISGAISVAQPTFVLNGVSVRIGRVAARISSISAGRVTFVSPNGIANGVFDFSINDNGVQYTGSVVIVDASPGIFTTASNGDPTGPVGADCYDIPTGTYSSPPCVANNNTFLVLYGTGWRNAASGLQVKINDTTLTPTFSGIQDNPNGIDQINVILPNSLAGVTGGIISVITVNTNIESNRATIDIQGLSPTLTVFADGAGRASVDCVSSLNIYYNPPCVTGDVMAIYGTGWRSAPSTQVVIGSLTVTPIYSGIQSATTDQINIISPPELAGMTDLPMTVIAGGSNVASNTVLVSFLGSPTSLTVFADGAGRATVDCVSRQIGRYYSPPCVAGDIMAIYGIGWRGAPGNPGTQVSIGGIAVVIPIYSGVQGRGVDQINIIVPPEVAGMTDLSLRVFATINTVGSNTVLVSFLGPPTSLNIFTDSAGGADVDCVTAAGDFYNQPCASGDTLVLYGTGWRSASSMQVRIANMLFTPVFSGVQGGLTDQINITVPSQMAGLTNVPISVLVAGTSVESNTATISFRPSP